MGIWTSQISLKEIRKFESNSMVTHLGIEFTEFGDDYLIAKMPVDHRTIQPHGLLHGGASVALAETLGSIAATLSSKSRPLAPVVGVEINANHLKSARSGYVYGKVTPIRIGRKIQVWQININDEQGDPICISRLTTMILDKT